MSDENVSPARGKPGLLLTTSLSVVLLSLMAPLWQSRAESQRDTFPLDTCHTFDDCDLDCPSGAHLVVKPPYFRYCAKNQSTYHGPYTRWYDSQQIHIASLYENGTRHGPITVWHPNGERNIEGFYDAGLGTGEWRVYADNGQLIEQGMYERDEKTGVWRTWSTTGQLRSEEVFAGGKRHGIRVEWNTSGVKIAEMTFDQGQLDGDFTFWFSSGQVSSQGQLVDRKPHGSWTYYTFDGDVAGTCRFDHGNGRWMSWDGLGSQVARGEVRDGSLCGDFSCWQNGEPSQCNLNQSLHYLAAACPITETGMSCPPCPP